MTSRWLVIPKIANAYTHGFTNTEGCLKLTASYYYVFGVALDRMSFALNTKIEHKVTK